MYVKPVQIHPGKRRRTKQLNSFYTIHPSIKNHLGETSLIIATQIGAYRYAEKLIAQGTDITVSDVLQKTPLHYCVEASLFTTAKKLLLRNDVNVNAKDIYGNTPLHLGVENENTTIGRILLAKGGTDISLENNDGETPFSLSIKRNKTNMIRLFLPLVNLDEQDHFKRTLLHWAAEKNAPYTLAALLNRTSKNIKDINGETPLTIALKNKNDKAVMMLSETKHSDVDTMDNNGDTPLHIACSHGNSYVIQKVLKTKILSIKA
jgi:ankyrin repeat protein